MRQEILKELKFLLKEVEEVDYSTAKAGGSYGSGGIGRTIGTAAIPAGGAALLSGGAAAAGMAAGATAGTLAAAAFPIVAVGAVALGAAYLAFRTAGWKEVAEDIVDGNFVSDDDVAAKLSTKKYLDLTTMEDATDEADMKSFMAAMKGLIEAYAETETLEEYKNFIDQANSQKGILEKVCNNFVLLNEFGQNDRMYFVKCAKVAAYMPPTSVKESLFLEAEVQQTVQPAKCAKIEGIQIPSVLYKVALENDISDSQKMFRAPAAALPLITCPLIEKLCGTGEQPAPSPTPKPEEGKVGTQGKNSFKCPNQDDVAVFQQWLGVKEDCSVGVNTIKAAQSKGMKLTLQDYFSAESLTPGQKQNQIQFCNSLKTNRPGYETAIKNAGQTVRGKCPATSGGGSGKKSNIPKAGSIACQGEFVSLIKGRYMGLKKNKNDSGVDIIIDNNIDQSLKTAVDYLASTLNVPQKTVKNCEEAEQFYKYVRPAKPLQENYYDNKKLNEAKQLFNKLLKNI